MTNKEERYFRWFMIASFVFDIPKEKIKPLFSKLLEYEFNTFPIEVKIGKEKFIYKPSEFMPLKSLDVALKCAHKKSQKSKNCKTSPTKHHTSKN